MAKARAKIIYIAGPLFSDHERAYLEHIVEEIAGACLLDPQADFFLPHRDAGDLGISGERDEMFDADVEALRSAKFVVALLDGQDVDSGTAVELGYAYGSGKAIFGLLTDRRSRDSKGGFRINNMIWGVCGQGRRIFKDIQSLAAAVRGMT